MLKKKIKNETDCKNYFNRCSSNFTCFDRLITVVVTFKYLIYAAEMLVVLCFITRIDLLKLLLIK